MISTLFTLAAVLVCSYAQIDVSSDAQTITELAVATEDLSTLVGALQSTGLDAVLSSPGNYTVFAPTNAAFDLITVPDEIPVLTDVLYNHVVPFIAESSILSSGLVAPTLSTLNGFGSVTCSLDGGVFFYDSFGRKAEVTVADIIASNGVIHIVDMVLLPGGTVDDITGNVEELTSLDGALAANSLDIVLAAPANYTLFAPSNDAIAAFSGDITNNQLLYHVVTDAYLSFDVPDTETTLTTAYGSADIKVINTNGVVTVTDATGRVATVTMANIRGTNGVVHIIDTVLEYRSIVDIVVERDDLSTLETALGDAGLIPAFLGDGPFTVLAPTDTAFALIDTSGLNTTELANVLSYHVISGAVMSTDLSSGLVAETLIGETVTSQIDSGAYFYDSNGRMAMVSVADIIGTNGVIHVIDAVLLPGGTIDDITGNIADLAALDGALAANSIDIFLADKSAEFTLFAPTDAAVGAFSGDITADVLTYHVVAAKYLADDVPTSATALTTVNGAEITVVNTNGVVTITDSEGNVATVELANTVGVNGVVHVIDMVLTPPMSDMSTTMGMETTMSGANGVNAFIALSIGLFAYLF